MGHVNWRWPDSRPFVPSEPVKHKYGFDFNTHFAETNEEFRKCCEKAGIEPTARQASKWRNQRGRAFKEKRK